MTTSAAGRKRSRAASRHLGRAVVGWVALAGATGFLAPHDARAQDHHPMRFSRIAIEDGLSQSHVLAIWQDSTGHMWFGTENGLDSYDGYELRHFRHERGNLETLASDFIYDIDEDANGNLWIATNGGGLARIERGTQRIRSYRHDPADSDSIGSDIVRSLVMDADGTIWAGTRGAGLDHFDPKTGRATHFRFDGETQTADEIHVLHEDSTGTLWIGSDQGLTRFSRDTGEATTFAHDDNDPASLSDSRVRSIFEDGHGRLWVGTYGGGLNRFDRESGAFERFRHDPVVASSLASDRVTTVFEDADGRLWVGTTAGLNLFDESNRSFVRYGHDAADVTSLGDDSVTAIFQDRGGLLWVGTQNRGVSKWNPRTWAYGLDDAHELVADRKSEPNVTSFLVDRSGTLWVGTFGEGLSALDRKSGTTRSLRHDPRDAASLSDDRVMSLLEDKQGRIWAGTMTGGINVIDQATGSVEHFRHDANVASSVGADGIMAMLEDSNGFVWVGTFGAGVSRFDPRTGAFRSFPANTEPGRGPSSNRVTSFAEDVTGSIWIGTDGGGLNVFDPRTERFHYLRNDATDTNTLSSDTVYAIKIDPTGTVWVGTRGGGLDRVVGGALDPERIRFENLSVADGLPNDVVYGVEFDDTGRLWLSTNFGLGRFNPLDGSIRRLHRTDGLQSEEFNFGAHYRSPSGELFFGGQNGFNAFLPETLEPSEAIPAIALLGYLNSSEPLRAEDGSFDLSGGVDLSYRDDVVSFEVAALDYAAPEHNRYMYKLEGFDRDWIDLGTDRRMTFTDLDHGNYVLRVKAASSDGVWNDAGIALPVSVAPAPWETWWAYLGYVATALALAAALYLGHRRKIRREEEYSQRLELEVRQRTEKLIEANSKLNEANRALQETSLSDPLTGLRNRRFVLEEVSRDLEVIRRRLDDEAGGVDPRNVAALTFMMIDLDHFKPINDTYGHAAGDRMLLEVRDVLLKTCRRSDFVIRWGGDEFVVIAKQAKPGESEALAERIRSDIANHQFKVGDGQVVRTTCSIGFAAYPLFRSRTDETNLDQIINLADNLMYESKKQRNAWAGMLSPSAVATSANIDIDSLEPTSVLFRAHRAGAAKRRTDHAEAVASVLQARVG
jgi:diguanylate cyclase (GGDEF)-like protein